MFEAPPGRLWAASARFGLFSLELESRTWRRHAGLYPQAAVQTASGEVWLGGFDGALLRLDRPT